MTNELIVAAVVGGLVGLGGVARTAVPALALLLVLGGLAYVAVAQVPIQDAVEWIAGLARRHIGLAVAGLGGAVAGQLVHTLLRTRSAE